MGDEEQRKFFRLPWSVRIRWQKGLDVDGDISVWVDAETKDLSAGGLRLTLTPELKAGDFLRLEMKLGAERILYLKGKVMWMKKDHEAGVDFFQMDGETRGELTRYIAKALQNGI